MDVTPAMSRRSAPAVCGIGSVVGGLLVRAVGCTVNVCLHLWQRTGEPRCCSETKQGAMQWGQWARTGTATPTKTERRHRAAPAGPAKGHDETVPGRRPFRGVAGTAVVVTPWAI